MSSNISSFAKNQHIIKNFNSDEPIVSESELMKLAELAKIDLSEEEKVEYLKGLEDVIGWINKLDEVKTETYSFFTSNVTKVEDITKKDQVCEKRNISEDIVCHTESEHKCFVVPKIIENE